MPAAGIMTGCFRTNSLPTAASSVEYAEVVNYFNQVFLGENGDGLIRYEEWMPNEGLLNRLSERARLAIFTGRAQYEADITLGAVRKRYPL